MGIVYHQRKCIGYFYHFYPALCLRLTQCLLHNAGAYAKMTAYRYRSQGIVYAEFTGDVNFHIKIQLAGNMVGHAKAARFLQKLYIFRPQISVF